MERVKYKDAHARSWQKQGLGNEVTLRIFDPISPMDPPIFFLFFFFWWLFFPFPFCWHPSYLAVADWSLQMPPQRYRLLFFDINLLRLDAIRRSVVCLVTLSTCTVSYWRHWRVVLLLCYYAHPILSLLNSFAFLLT